jgi:hypothetical protein
VVERVVEGVRVLVRSLGEPERVLAREPLEAGAVVPRAAVLESGAVVLAAGVLVGVRARRATRGGLAEGVVGVGGLDRPQAVAERDRASSNAARLKPLRPGSPL